MTDDDQLTNLFETYLTFLDGDGEEPDLTGLDPEVRSQVTRQFAILRDSHGLLADMPTLAEDPVFAALGFDRAGSDVAIDGTKLKRARQRTGLDLGEVVGRMRNAGSSISVRQLLQLERESSTPLAQPDATALVAALRISLSDIEGEGSRPSLLQTFFHSDPFTSEVRQWSEMWSRDYQRSARRAQSELLAANFRGDADYGDLLKLLRLVLEKMASGDDRKPR